MPITKAQAIAARYRDQFVHATLKDSAGAPVRCRVNGTCQTWKTRPDDFRLPVKYGLRECFYITPSNAAQWSVDAPVASPRLDGANGYRVAP